MPSVVYLTIIWPQTLVDFMNNLLIDFAERVCRRSRCLRARFDTRNKVDELQHELWVPGSCGVGEVYCSRLRLRNFPLFPSMVTGT